MTRTIVLTGARGGQGTSTVAAALAVLAAGHGPTQFVPDDPSSTSALLGVPITTEEEWAEVCPNLVMATNARQVTLQRHPTTTVIDCGRLPNGPFDGESSTQLLERAERYVVLRGPCYIALTSVLATGTRFDGVILVVEPGRALSDHDVTDVLGIPVVATRPVDPAIARCIDAGLLLTRLHRITGLARPLSVLARPSRNLSEPPLQPDTDLPLSLGDRNAAKIACRARPVSRAVYKVWRRNAGRRGHVEHRKVVAGRGRLLRR